MHSPICLLSHYFTGFLFVFGLNENLTSFFLFLLPPSRIPLSTFAPFFFFPEAWWSGGGLGMPRLIQTPSVIPARLGRSRPEGGGACSSATSRRQCGGTCSPWSFLSHPPFLLCWPKGGGRSSNVWFCAGRAQRGAKNNQFAHRFASRINSIFPFFLKRGSRGIHSWLFRRKRPPEIGRFELEKDRRETPSALYTFVDICAFAVCWLNVYSSAMGPLQQPLPLDRSCFSYSWCRWDCVMQVCCHFTKHVLMSLCHRSTFVILLTYVIIKKKKEKQMTSRSSWAAFGLFSYFWLHVLHNVCTL